MILPFSTIINKKPSYFPEKILIGLLEKRLTNQPDFNSLCPVFVIINKGYIKYKIDFDTTINHRPKYHTIREDVKARWKEGTKIDFFINVRQPNMYRFAPVLPVVSTQKVEFIWKDNTENQSCLGITYDRTCTIMIDDKFYADAYLLNDWVVSSSYNLKDFANNDGFDTIEDFFDYFNENYTGKLIHWTDLKY